MLCIKFWKYTNKTSRKPYFRLMTIWKAEPISAFEFRMFYQKVISWKRPGKLRYASHTKHTHRQAVTFVMVRRTALESFNEAVGRLYCAGQKECCFHTRQMNGFVSLSFRLFGFWALFEPSLPFVRNEHTCAIHMKYHQNAPVPTYFLFELTNQNGMWFELSSQSGHNSYTDTIIINNMFAKFIHWSYNYIRQIIKTFVIKLQIWAHQLTCSLQPSTTH